MAKVFAKIKKGVSFAPGLTAAPADLEDGDIYYRSDLGKLRQKVAGVESDLGSSAGDITNIESRLQSRFQISSWRALTPNVIATDQATKVASSTGTLETSDYLLGTGQNLVSTQLLDAEFLAASVLPLSAEVQVCYDLTAVDPNPTIQLSRDGGSTLQTVTVTKSSGDDSWKGNIVFSNLEPAVPVNFYNVGNADQFRQLSTTTQQAEAQSIILASTTVINDVTLYLNKLGSPVGTYTVSIVKDSAGSPSTSRGDYYTTSATQDIASMPSGSNAFVITFPSQIVLPAGTYWIVIETDTAYKASFVSATHALRPRTDESAPTAGGVFSLFNGTTWTNQAGIDMVYVVDGYVLDLRFKVTSSAAATKLKGYGVFYDKGVDATVGRSNRYEVAFDGATNPTSFDLTNSGFIPDPKLLMVFWANTGQVLVNPVFDTNGYTITFANNQFLSTGTQRLIFWQPLGSSFDNNEKNAAIIAANFLGSTDTNLDRSVAGRGIFLRRPDGTLREIAIDNSDNIVVYSV